MARTAAIGIQDFSKLIENDYFYIDKTSFIKEWWESGDDVTLIMRPRRFGKTLNMSMLEYFFSIRHAGRSDLFEGLSVWQDEKYHALQGSYPVISLSLADVKAADYQGGLCKALPDSDRSIFTALFSAGKRDSDRTGKSIFPKGHRPYGHAGCGGRFKTAVVFSLPLLWQKSADFAG